MFGRLVAFLNRPDSAGIVYRLGELLHKGEKKQTHHLHHHARAYNTNLSVLTTAMEAFLTAKAEDLDPYRTVFAAVPEATLAATVARAKALVRPIDLDSLDLVEPKYARMRGALLALYAELDVQAVRGTDSALDALDYVQDLAQHKRRVTRKQQTVAGERRHAPLDHLGDRWRRHVLHGHRINANNYEAAAFEALRDGLRPATCSCAAATATAASTVICWQMSAGTNCAQPARRDWP